MYDDIFESNVNNISVPFKAPLGIVHVGEISFEAMADSGSPITILSDNCFRHNWTNVNLKQSDINPKAFGNFDIHMLGFFEDTLRFESREVFTKIYVAIDGKNIVGWYDLGKLGVILCPGSDHAIQIRDTVVQNVSMIDSHLIIFYKDINYFSRTGWVKSRDGYTKLN